MEMVRKTASGQTTIYAGAHSDRNLDSGVHRRYYFFGNQRVAMRTGATLYFLHGDHLGSTSLATDEAGSLVPDSLIRFYPYGEARLGNENAAPTDYLFAGQRLERTTGGMYHMGARFYHHGLGRWISPDTIVPDPANPQSLNRFSYVSNNPIRYTDPSGHGACSGDDYDPACELDILPLDEFVIGFLQGMIEGVFDPERIEPIFIPLDDGNNLVIMPPDSDPFQERSPSLQRGGDFLSRLGFAMDMFEILSGPGSALSDAGAYFDIAVAGVGSAFSGDMWIRGRPHPDLPLVLLTGQDVIVASGDAALPWLVGGTATGLGGLEVGAAAKVITDIGTTAVSGFYDLSRAQGHFPTVVNTGISWEWPPQGYILVYP